jgi:hypothetical protein
MHYFNREQCRDFKEDADGLVLTLTDEVHAARNAGRVERRPHKLWLSAPESCWRARRRTNTQARTSCG